MSDGLCWVLAAMVYVLLVVGAVRLFRFAPDDPDWVVPEVQTDLEEKWTDRH